MAYLIRDAVFTVDFTEFEESPSESGKPGWFEATKQFKCAWGDRVTLAAELMGHVELVEDVHVHYRPHAYPDHANVYARSYRIKPFGEPQASGDTTLRAWSHAILTVEYSPATWSAIEQDSQGPGEVTLVTEDVRPALEILTGSKEAVYADASQEEQVENADAPGLEIQMVEWQYTMHQVVAFPSALFTLIGHCNNDTVRSRTFGWTFAAETLKYYPPRLSRSLTLAGLTAWEIGIRFMARIGDDGDGGVITWNKFPSSGGKYKTLYDGNGDPLVYVPLGDFDSIVV